MTPSDFFNTLGQLARGRVPGQLVIQITDHCNARCPQCGMRAATTMARHRLGLDRAKVLLDIAAAKGVKAVSFTGGEPFLLLDDLLAMIRHAGSLGMNYIRTGTNGFWLARPQAPGFYDRVSRIADQLAATPLRNLWISVDSAVASIHEEMRGFEGAVAGMEKALPLFHQRGIYPAANLGLNRWITEETRRDFGRFPDRISAAYLNDFEACFRRGLDRFYRFVLDLGFTMANTCYPMSVSDGNKDLSAVYAATATADVVRFAPAETAALFGALMGSVAAFRRRLRIFSPLSSLHQLAAAHAGDKGLAYPCLGGKSFFFADARGEGVFPCGYRGQDALGPLQDVDLAALDKGKGCTACDWECFRDPSTLFGPPLEAFSRPLALGRRLIRDPRFFALWAKDLAYYRACRFFDGR